MAGRLRSHRPCVSNDQLCAVMRRVDRVRGAELECGSKNLRRVFAQTIERVLLLLWCATLVLAQKLAKGGPLYGTEAWEERPSNPPWQRVKGD